MLFAFSIAPTVVSTQDASMHDVVADVVQVIRDSGLPNRTDSMFTTIEGDWDECMDVIKRATEACAKHSPRVSLVLKADIRPGHTGEMQGKVDRLEAALAAKQD